MGQHDRNGGSTSSEFTIRDSYQSESETYNCPECSSEYEFAVWVSIGGGYIDLPFDDEYLVNVEETPSEEYEKYVEEQIELALAEHSPFNIFNQAISQFDRTYLLGDTVPELNVVLKRQAYAGLVASMEAYLSSTFITHILNDKTYFVNFVENFEKFKKENFSLSEFYSIEKKLTKKVRFELTEIIYHNLYKVKPIFETVFKKDLPEFSNLTDIVKIRHDIVHRNGMNKEGEMFEATEDRYNTAKEYATHFVTEIHNLIG